MALFKRKLRGVSTDTKLAVQQLLDSHTSMQDDLEQRDRELSKKLEELEKRIKTLEVV